MRSRAQHFPGAQFKTELSLLPGAQLSTEVHEPSLPPVAQLNTEAIEFIEFNAAFGTPKANSVRSQ
jgi:hypothetical protein